MKKLLIGILALTLFSCSKDENESKLDNGELTCPICERSIENTDSLRLLNRVYIGWISDGFENWNVASNAEIVILSAGDTLLVTKTDPFGQLNDIIPFPKPYGHFDLHVKGYNREYTIPETYQYKKFGWVAQPEWF